jgi:transcriptional regulator with XRE-family HTH domain
MIDRTKPRPARKSNDAYGRGTGNPHPVDIHVGQQIRIRRLFLGMNQETLARALELTFQQVQKYEGGANRVSASRLKQMADILDVPIGYFFQGIEEPDDPAEKELRRRLREDPAGVAELVRLYYAMPKELRAKYLALVKGVNHRPTTIPE